MLGRTDPDQARGLRWFFWLVAGGLIVGGLIVGATIGLLTDEDKWGWGLILVLGVLAGFSLVRNLLGRTRSPSEEPGPARWWHKALALTLLFLAFMVKGLGTLGLSVAGAVINAAIAMGVLGVVGAGVFLYERRHGDGAPGG